MDRIRAKSDENQVGRQIETPKSGQDIFGRTRTGLIEA
jgi:hypothetical protein